MDSKPAARRRTGLLIVAAAAVAVAVIGFGIFFGWDVNDTKSPIETTPVGGNHRAATKDLDKVKEETSAEAESMLKAPQFKNARVHVRSGQDRAYVGYTIIGHGDNQYASPETIRAVGEDGRAIDWKHQTATGGPADVFAMDGSRVEAPGSPESGDADYFDASDVRVGETITVTFRFVLPPNPDDGSTPPRAVHLVKVPFKVVQA